MNVDDIDLFKDKLIEYRDNALKLYELRSSSYEYENLEDKFSNRLENLEQEKLKKKIDEDSIEAVKTLLAKGFIEDTHFINELNKEDCLLFMAHLLKVEEQVLKKDKYNNLFRLNELFKNRLPS